jgi:predicted dehydrogenase
MRVLPFINVGLVGCGDHAREVILPALFVTPGVRVIALSDNGPERLALARQMCPAAATSNSFEELCDRTDVDAVIVVATPQIHAAAAARALKNRKHVFVEKPLAATWEEAEMLASIAATAGKVTMVGNNFRFAPAFERVKIVMSDSGFGKAMLLEIRYHASKPRGDRWGLKSPERSFLLSHGSHAIDIALDLFGDRLEVADATIQAEKNSLFGVIRLAAPDGKQCSLCITNGAPHFDIGVSITGSNGSLVEMQSLREVRNFGDPEHFKRIGQIWVPPTLISGFTQPGYAGEMNAFFTAIRSGRFVRPSFADGTRVLAIIDQVLRVTVPT